MLALALAVMMAVEPTTTPPGPNAPMPQVAMPMPTPGSMEALLLVERNERISRITRERAELREELQDATYGGPILKLIGATAFTVLGVVMWSAYGNSFDGYSRSTSLLTGTITSGIAALALYIWGGIQLRNRVDANQRLPREIDEKTDQLRLLGAY